MLKSHRQGFFVGERLLLACTGEESSLYRVSTNPEYTPRLIRYVERVRYDDENQWDEAQTEGMVFVFSTLMRML
jgi:hypothetical protein